MPEITGICRCGREDRWRRLRRWGGEMKFFGNEKSPRIRAKDAKKRVDSIKSLC